MRNQYTLDGDSIAIRVRCRGTWKTAYASARDLALLQRLPVTWHASPARKSTSKFYAFAKLRVAAADGTVLYRTLSMHRYIMGEPANDVQHIDNDGLNNRRDNIDPMAHQENMRERWPERDWRPFDACRDLAAEYRLERNIARIVQNNHGLVRQTMFMIRNRRVHDSPAAREYRECVLNAGIRDYFELRMTYPSDQAQWGVYESGGKMRPVAKRRKR